METVQNQNMKQELKVTIQLAPGASAAEIELQPNQQFTAEGGSMIAMSPNVQMTTSTRTKQSGGIIRGLKRMISGESFFLNHYTA
ncbi:MAG: AIM24 family protein, partial [Bacteroidales bacterium]|nr:AIM24 family protein [Bacteroidales bacterium]